MGHWHFNLGRLLIVCCLFSKITAAQPQLVLEPGSHLAQITGLMVNNKTNQIISVSQDKTIRFWEMESGLQSKCLRGAINQSSGNIYCAALSPDTRYLTIGGYFPFNDKLTGRIKTIDLTSLKQVSTINKNFGSAYTLKYSPDGRYLVSAGSNGAVKIWDAHRILQTKNDEALLGTFTDHTEDVYETDFSPDSKHLATASLDGSLCLWDVSDEPFLLVAKRTGFKNPVKTIVFSPSGQYIATGSGVTNELLLWDHNLSLVRRIDKLPNEITRVRFSKDEKYLIASCMLGDIYVYHFPECTQAYIFNKHDNTVSALETASVYLDGKNCQIAVSASGAGDEISIWDVSTGKILKKISGKGRPVYSVGFLDKNSIAFGNTVDNESLLKNYIDKGPYEKTFSFEDFQLRKIHPGEVKNLKTAKTQWGNLRLSVNFPYLTELSIGHKNAIKIDNGIELIRSFTFNHKGNIVVGTSFSIWEYDQDKRAIKTYLEHNGEIMSLAVLDSFLLSGGTDGVIKLWNMNSEGNRSIDLHEFERLEKKNYRTEQEYLSMLAKMKISSEQHYKRSVKGVVRPAVSLFVTKEGEWICWSENNYYASSKKGSSFVGFHIEHGPDTLAEFYPFEQFDLKYNRPDTILEMLGHAPKNLILAYRRAYNKRLAKMGFTRAMLDAKSHVPYIKIITTNIPIKTAEKKLNITITASDTEVLLDRLNVYVNDVPIHGSGGISLRALHTREHRQTLNLTLTPGENKIQVSVLNQAGAESLKETFYITCTAPTRKPDLYLLGIGVGKFANNTMNLNYPAKDVVDWVSLFPKNNAIYGQIFIDTILDGALSRKRLHAMKQKLLNSQPDDRVILFVAGHGILDANLDYYFATYGTDFTHPQSRAIPYEALENLLDSIPARQKLLLMDACHAGEIDKENVAATRERHTDFKEVRFRAVGTNLTPIHLGLENSFEFMKEVFVDLRRGTGATVIASAGGMEWAMEGAQWNNSVFMYALLTGMKDKKADLNKDGAIMISELQLYLGAEVEKLTNGSQRPTSRTENVFNNWQIW